VTLDIILTWNALKNMKFTQLLRYFLKFVVAAVWVVVLPICYSSSLVNPSGLIKFVTSWAGDWGPQSLYTYVVVLYMCPNIVGTILFFIPPLRRKLERSNMRILTILMWWAQVSNIFIYLFIFLWKYLTDASCIYIFISLYFLIEIWFWCALSNFDYAAAKIVCRKRHA